MLVESPWVRHFQENFEADEFQPLLDIQDPVLHYLQVREAFALCGRALQAPIGRKFPPTVALRAIVEKNPVPLITDWTGPLPSLAIQCQFALLLSIAGEKEAAAKWARELAPVVLGQFWTLWTLEREYDEEQTRISCALFLRSIGQSEEADRLYRPALPKSPFFSFLFQQNPQIEYIYIHTAPFAIVEPRGFEPVQSQILNHVRYRPIEQIVWTLNGSKAGVGAMRIGNVHIPAFGPHAAPLTNPNLFGVECGEEGWFCASALKDIWFQIKPLDSNAFSLQSVGIDPETPLAFVFYVSAEQCQIGDRLFKSKSLQRYLGEGTEVHFGKAAIAVDRPLKIELIPLSGGKSYWGAGFLLAFWLPPLSNKLFFHVK